MNCCGAALRDTSEARRSLGCLRVVSSANGIAPANRFWDAGGPAIFSGGPEKKTAAQWQTGRRRGDGRWSLPTS